MRSFKQLELIVPVVNASRRRLAGLPLNKDTALPDPELLLAAPEGCYSFANQEALVGAEQPDEPAGNTWKNELVKKRQYAPVGTKKAKRLVLLDDGGCLELFEHGIPQSVREAAGGKFIYRQDVTFNTMSRKSPRVVDKSLPLLSVADYARLLPPVEQDAERARFRSSYPDPTLLAELNAERDRYTQEHNRTVVPGPWGNVDLSVTLTGLRRPAFALSLPGKRWERVSAELWAAGFEPARLPAIYRNYSRCHPEVLGENATAETRLKVNIENCLDAWAGGHAIAAARNVPHLFVEDDVVLATSRFYLHSIMDNFFSEYDVAPLAHCSLDLQRFSCGHAAFSSASASRVLARTARRCSTLNMLMDRNAIKLLCPQRNGYLRCRDWRNLNVVPQTRIHELYPKREDRFPLELVAAKEFDPQTKRVKWVNKWKPGKFKRFMGWGFWVQDRVGVEATLHDFKNNAVSYVKTDASSSSSTM